MRLLAGIDRPDEGVRLEGHNVVMDYFAQNQAEVLNPARTVVEEMSASSSLNMAPMIRTILGGFLFEGDDVFKKVAVLSGGERNRLALAKMLLQASNVLLLDEPTNHLDLDSKEILLEALEAYGGTLVFVSHDRYFVDKLANKVIEVGGGEAPLYPGGYEDFLYWKKQREGGVDAPMPIVAHRRGKEEDDGTASVATKRTGSAAAQPSPPATAPAAAKGRGSAAAGGRDHPTAGTGAAKSAGKAGSPDGSNGQPPAPANPMAPRLRPSAATPERQVLERELKRAKVRLVELEKRVTEKEQAVKAARGADVRALLLRRPRPRRPGRRGPPEAHVGDGRPHGPVGGPSGRGRREVGAARRDHTAGGEAIAPSAFREHRKRRSGAGTADRVQTSYSLRASDILSQLTLLSRPHRNPIGERCPVSIQSQLGAWFDRRRRYSAEPEALGPAVEPSPAAGPDPAVSWPGRAG